MPHTHLLKECSQPLNKISCLCRKMPLQPSCFFYSSQGRSVLTFFSTVLRNSIKLIEVSAAHCPNLQVRGGQGLKHWTTSCQLLTGSNSKTGLQAVPSHIIALKKVTSATSHLKCNIPPLGSKHTDWPSPDPYLRVRPGHAFPLTLVPQGY